MYPDCDGRHLFQSVAVDPVERTVVQPEETSGCPDRMKAMAAAG